MIFLSSILVLNTLKPRQNGRHFADDIFKCILFNGNVWIPITISLKFVPQGPINSILELVQIMAWCQAGNKPLCEPKVVRLLVHICITQPQWIYMSCKDGAHISFTWICMLNYNSNLHTYTLPFFKYLSSLLCTASIHMRYLQYNDICIIYMHW